MWETLGRLASAAFGSLGVIFSPYEEEVIFSESVKETPKLPKIISQGVVEVPLITPYKLPINSHLGVTYNSYEVSYFTSFYLLSLRIKTVLNAKNRMVRIWKVKYLHSMTISI